MHRPEKDKPTELEFKLVLVLIAAAVMLTLLGVRLDSANAALAECVVTR